MQKYKNLIIGTAVMCLTFSGFSQNCKKFINYETKTFDSEGVGLSLPGGMAKGNFGKFNISTLQRTTSEKLEQLDMMQFTICQQLKNIKSTFLRDQAQVQYSNLLMKIMNLLNADGGVGKSLAEQAPTGNEIAAENHAASNNQQAEMPQQQVVTPQQNEVATSPVAASQPQATTPAPVVVPAASAPAPEPVYTPTAAPCESNTYKSDKDYLRSFGYGESKNRGMAKDYASSAALEGLALSMEVTVKVVGQHYRLSAKKGDYPEEFEERLEKTTQTSINQTVRNINVLCEGEVRNPVTNNWEYFIVYEVSRQEAVKTVYNALQNDAMVKETLPNHEKFKQTFDEVMKEYDQSKEMSFDF